MAAPILSNLSSGTEMFGIGKGEAQVLDLSPMERMTTQKRQQKFAQEQAGLKAKKTKAAKREDDLLKLMAKSRGTKLKPGDIQYFKDAQGKVSQMMMDALDDNEINNEEYMKILGLANQINAEADMSASQKAQLEKGMGEFSDITMRPEAYEQMQAAYQSQGNWGQQFKNITNIDTNAAYRALRKDTAAQLREKGRRIDTNEATDILTKQIVGNRQLMDQVKYDLGGAAGAKKAYGDITDEEAIDSWVNRNVDDLARQGITPPMSAALQNLINKNINYTIDDLGNIKFDDPTDKTGKTVTEIPHPSIKGSKIRVHSSGLETEKNAQGVLVPKGAWVTIDLSKEQFSANRGVDAANAKLDTKLTDIMLKWDRQKANKPPVQAEGFAVPGTKTRFLEDTDEEHAKAMQIWEKKRADKVSAQKKMLGYTVKTHPEGTYWLEGDDAVRVFHGQTKGMDFRKLLSQKEKTPRANVQVIKATQTGGRRGTVNGRPVIRNADGTITYLD